MGVVGVTCNTDNSGSGNAHELLRLDNQLCFALYAATRAITRTYRERLDSLNLTYPQYLVLLVLWEQDALSVGEIGRKLMLDSGTLTPLLKRMEAQEFVQRSRDTGDERVVVIRLSEKGRVLKDGALEARLHVACRLEMTESAILELREDLVGLTARLSSDKLQDAAE